MRLFLSLLCVLCLVPATAPAQDMPGMAMPGGTHHHHDAPLPGEKLGHVSFPSSCTPKSQAGMERGIALLHSFGYAKAQMQFAAIERADPACAMAHWGAAMTQYQELWGEPDAEALRVGAQEMAAARDLKATATPRERAYIDALSAFFAPPDASFRQRADTYADAMDRLHAAFPDDVEGAAFDALAILADATSGDASLSHERRALAILEPLFEAHPDHPGLAHYIIHTCDTPALAPEGLKAARVYARIAPASPHALHMPAHIFARLGLWQDDIASNLASVAASQRAEAAHEPGAAHQMHAKEFLTYAYLQTGDDAKAHALTQAMAGLGHHMAAMPGMDDMKDDGHFFDNELRAIYALEMHDWSAATQLKPAPGTQAFEAFDVYWAQGIAASHLRDARQAAAALAAFDQSLEALKTSPYADYAGSLTIKRNEMLGWQALAEGRSDDAIAAMRAAADDQDRHGQNEVDIPAREMLGDVLLAAHRPEAALAEYHTALQLSPNRLNGLLGAAQAAEQSGHAAEAKALYATVARQTNRGKATRRAEVRLAIGKA